MKRLSILGVMLSAIACAHTPQATPLHVVVSTSNGARGLVDTVVLQRITEAEIQRADGNVTQPLTLTVSFDSYAFVRYPDAQVRGPLSSRSTQGPTVSAVAVPYLSATPWDDGMIVERESKFSSGPRREVAFGMYTISDEAGNVREQRAVVVGVPDPQTSRMPLQLASMKTTAQYLAERVVALSQ